MQQISLFDYTKVVENTDVCSVGTKAYEVIYAEIVPCTITSKFVVSRDVLGNETYNYNALLDSSTKNHHSYTTLVGRDYKKNWFLNYEEAKHAADAFYKTHEDLIINLSKLTAKESAFYMSTVKNCYDEEIIRINGYAVFNNMVYIDRGSIYPHMVSLNSEEFKKFKIEVVNLGEKVDYTLPNILLYKCNSSDWLYSAKGYTGICMRKSHACA